MGIILVILFATIGVLGLVNAKNKTKNVKLLLIIDSLIILAIQGLYISRLLLLGGLELMVLSGVFVLIALIVMFRKN